MMIFLAIHQPNFRTTFYQSQRHFPVRLLIRASRSVSARTFASAKGPFKHLSIHCLTQWMNLHPKTMTRKVVLASTMTRGDRTEHQHGANRNAFGMMTT